MRVGSCAVPDLDEAVNDIAAAVSAPLATGDG